MKRFSIALLLMQLTLAAFAQGLQRSVVVTENIAYRSDVGPTTVLDMAEPQAGPKSGRPAILIIHGGGWSAGSKNDAVYRSLMVDYAMKGYVVCNMNYRLIGEADPPACLEDVRCAIRWMKANAMRLGIDSTRIGTFGHSAGGHLSLMAALSAGSKAFADDTDPWREHDCTVACSVGGAPPTELGRPGISWGDRKELWPIGYIGSCTTPVLVIQGGEDPIVRPQLTEDWVQKMLQAGAPVDYMKVHGQHGVAFDQQLELTRPAMDAFFDRHLRPAVPAARASAGGVAYMAETLWIDNGGRRIYGELYTPLFQAAKAGPTLGGEADAAGKAPVAVIAHGFNGTHDYGRNYVGTLSRLGYACYTLDFPCGSLRSRSVAPAGPDGATGTMNMSIIDEVSDLKAVVAHFRNEGRQVVLVGESQGGLVSALTAADLKDQVSRLVLVYPALCIPDNWRQHYPHLDDIKDVTELWGVKMGRRFFEEIHDMHPLDVIGKYRGPVLIVQGDQDRVVSMDDSRRACKLYSKGTRLHVIPGAGHGFRPHEFGQEMEQLEQFLTLP